jgi:hypothetical protein
VEKELAPGYYNVVPFAPRGQEAQFEMALFASKSTVEFEVRLSLPRASPRLLRTLLLSCPLPGRHLA